MSHLLSRYDEPVDYVLPLKWNDDAGLPEITAYLRWLSTRAEVTVVDGSPAPIFAAHAAAWSGVVRHIAPDPDLRYANGKVNGVVTGLRLRGHERVIIADDDVRYDDSSLSAVVRLLHGYELIRPQNYFAPLPWHARWDTARSLLNRSVGADYPGTFGVRRSAFARIGAYDGDVLFENLEMIRTIRAYGGREHSAQDVYVRRLPPEGRRFLEQRVRQAYDELAQPIRMAAFLGVVPAAVHGLATGRHRAVATGTVFAVGLAELGRRRAGGAAVFPASATLLAPVWLAERGVCAWIALALRVTRRGVGYAGGRLLVAAHSERELRAHARFASWRI